MFLARWTHEAAREGTVPLCGDDIWNPRTSLASPHSGLMKQPTKEGSVSEIPEGMNGGPRRKDLTQGSLIVSRTSEFGDSSISLHSDGPSMLTLQAEETCT